MIKYFFDINTKEESRALFDKLNIKKDKQIMEQQGTYPVIFITLKELKSDSFEGFLNKLRLVISKEFARHENIINNEKLNESDVSYIINGQF